MHKDIVRFARTLTLSGSVTDRTVDNIAGARSVLHRTTRCSNVVTKGVRFVSRFLLAIRKQCEPRCKDTYGMCV
jgi:hypothetical protein